MGLLTLLLLCLSLLVSFSGKFGCFCFCFVYTYNKNVTHIMLLLLIVIRCRHLCKSRGVLRPAGEQPAVSIEIRRTHKIPESQASEALRCKPTNPEGPERHRSPGLNHGP